jgi:hypothetical protein
MRAPSTFSFIVVASASAFEPRRGPPASPSGGVPIPLAADRDRRSLEHVVGRRRLEVHPEASRRLRAGCGRQGGLAAVVLVGRDHRPIDAGSIRELLLAHPGLKARELEEPSRR